MASTPPTKKRTSDCLRSIFVTQSFIHIKKAKRLKVPKVRRRTSTMRKSNNYKGNFGGGLFQRADKNSSDLVKGF